MAEPLPRQHDRSRTIGTGADRSAVFPLLADPAGYEACAWPLVADAGGDRRRWDYWSGLFRAHIERLADSHLAEAADRGAGPAEAAEQAARVVADLNAWLDDIAAEPAAFGRMTVLRVCEARETALRRAGIADPYRLEKQIENTRAAAHYGATVAALDALPEAERRLQILRGVFAGNIFDLGATATMDMFAGGKTVDFAAVRDRLKPRPWHTDHADGFLGRWAAGRYGAACLFVDNAGPDILLGMLPLARQLLLDGVRVILTANATPSLNDVTAEELCGLVADTAAVDTVLIDALGDDRLRIVSSGNDCPLIDLRHVAPELAAACTDWPVDLVVLEGMGRSLESNVGARFACDALKVCMVKDAGVGAEIGAGLYDLVCRFDPSGR